MLHFLLWLQINDHSVEYPGYHCVRHTCYYCCYCVSKSNHCLCVGHNDVVNVIIIVTVSQSQINAIVSDTMLLLLLLCLKAKPLALCRTQCCAMLCSIPKQYCVRHNLSQSQTNIIVSQSETIAFVSDIMCLKVKLDRAPSWLLSLLWASALASNLLTDNWR